MITQGSENVIDINYYEYDLLHTINRTPYFLCVCEGAYKYDRTRVLGKRALGHEKWTN